LLELSLKEILAEISKLPAARYQPTATVTWPADREYRYLL